MRVVAKVVLTCFNLLIVSLALNSSANAIAINIVAQDSSLLTLKGIAIAQELKTDVYIGALYSPNGDETKQQLLSPQTSKRMILRYTIDNYSPRKVSRRWKERIAMNNPRSTWQPFTREIVEFSSLINDTIQPGDEMIIDYTPSRGTSIHLNGVEFAQFAGSMMFDLALNTWLGSVPPSKSFKDSMLGRTDQALREVLIKKFEGLSPVAGRFAKASTSDLSGQQGKTTQDTSNAVLDSPSKTSSSLALTQTKDALTSTSTNQTDGGIPKPIAKQESEQQNRIPQESVANTTLNHNTTPNQIAISSPDVSKSNNELPNNTSAEKQVANTNQNKPSYPLALEEIVLDADLIRGSYTRQLIAHIRKGQFYPVNARNRRHQGYGVAQVLINSFGELQDVRLTEHTGSRYLDRGVMQMIQRAAPFPTVPPELTQQSFEFEIPFTFKL